MTLRKLLINLWLYVRPYRWLVALALGLTLAGSLAAQVNAVVLDWAVDAINALLHQGLPADLFWGKATRVLVTITAVLLGKEVLAALITFGQRFYGEKMRIEVSRDLAQGVVGRMLTFRMGYFAKEGNEPGKLQTRIDRGVESLSSTVKNFFIDILPLGTSAVIALVLMFVANVYVGLVALCVVPVYFFITYRQARRLMGWRRDMRSSREAKSNGIVNILESMGVIKSFNREQIEGEKQLELQNRLTQNQMHTRRTGLAFDGLKTFTEQIGTVLIIILTAYLVLIDYPGMTIGKIMYHVMLFANVSAPIRQLHRIYDDMNDALIYAEGFFDIMDASGEQEPTGTYRPEHVHGDFKIEHVDFTYSNGNKALNDLSMEIPSGEITALVGLSGAGKTTIVNLLDKFYLPDKGRITLDGVDLREWDTRWLREHVGLVLQKNHIFEGSVEENIRYGNPNATHEQVMEAARQAYIYDQVMMLPDGFATRATQLSGSQQQRIAIARMFIKNPPIIFLDEPTASLDAVATEQIKNSLDAIKRGRTMVIISHSLGQIIDADRIYALKQGHVEQSGTPEEVYRQGGIYKEIFDASARSLNIDKIARTIGTE